jgi:hypothetical protein
MTGIAAVTLQNGMDLLKFEPDSCDDNEVTDVKFEAVTIKEEEVVIKEEEVTETDEEVTIKEEEDPLLIGLPLIEAEHEVSCMSVRLLLHHFASIQKCLVSSFLCVSLSLSLSLSMCIGNNSTWVISVSGRVPVLSAVSFSCPVFNGTL